MTISDWVESDCNRANVNTNIHAPMQVITPVAPKPVLFGVFGVRLPITVAKLLARLSRPGLLWVAALVATYAAVGASSIALAAQLTSDGGSPSTTGQ